MAILKNGVSDGFSGKLGNTVTYKLYGKWLKRTIGIRTTPITIAEMATHEINNIVVVFLKPFHDFIKIGYELESKIKLKTPYSLATSYLRLNAIAGEYPNRYINFAKVLLTKGKMPLVPIIAISKIEEGIEFTWDQSIAMKGIKDTDQAILIAYMPGRKVALQLMNAGRRGAGKALLPIPKSNTPEYFETYISFISENHKSITDSSYTGQLIW